MPIRIIRLQCCVNVDIRLKGFSPPTGKEWVINACDIKEEGVVEGSRRPVRNKTDVRKW